MRFIKTLRPLDDWELEVEFEDGTTRRFDMKPLLSDQVFQALREPSVFASVTSHGYFVEWCNGSDLSADTLYLDGRVFG